MDTYPFFSPLQSFSRLSPHKPQIVSFPNGLGSGESTCVRISPDASVMGFIHAPGPDINNRRLYMARIGEENHHAEDALTAVPEAQNESTYEPPTGFEFAGSSTSIVIQRQNLGREILLHLDLSSCTKPTPITTDGTVQAYYPLKYGDWNTLLVTRSTFIESCSVEIIQVKSPSERQLVLSATKNGAKFGLSREMVSDVYFKGADGIDVHTFIFRPSNFDRGKKYPWILLPHGGPTSAWTDAWSTRVSPTPANLMHMSPPTDYFLLYSR